MKEEIKQVRELV